MPLVKTKSEKREMIRHKRKRAPKGATLGGQYTRHKTSRHYRGLTKKIIKNLARARPCQ